MDEAWTSKRNSLDVQVEKKNVEAEDDGKYLHKCTKCI